MTTLYLCAAGNPEGVRLALEVNDAVPRWERIVILDDDPAKHGRKILDIPVVGPFAALADHRAGDEAVNLVARSTRGRDGARARIESFGIPLVSLIHPLVATTRLSSPRRFSGMGPRSAPGPCSHRGRWSMRGFGWAIAPISGPTLRCSPTLKLARTPR